MINTTIVLVNYNGWEDTFKCLRSLRALTVPASIILVDNASREDRMSEIEAEFPECITIRNPINGGWAGGNNTGLKYAYEQGAEQIILLNNDTTVSPKLVEVLLQTARENPDFGIIGPVINFMDNPDQVMTDGCKFNHPRHNGFFQREEVPLSSTLSEVEIVNGCCMMISRKVVDQIGFIDERFFLIHEESDYCLRARENGFRCGVWGESLVWHKGSSSFKRTGSRIQRYYDARNLFLLLNKHSRKHDTGRSKIASMSVYLKYVYYRYSLEKESGADDAAEAVLEGLCDALTRKYGPAKKRSRWGLPLIRMVFEGMRRVLTRRPS